MITPMAELASDTLETAWACSARRARAGLSAVVGDAGGLTLPLTPTAIALPSQRATAGLHLHGLAFGPVPMNREQRDTARRSTRLSEHLFPMLHHEMRTLLASIQAAPVPNQRDGGRRWAATRDFSRRWTTSPGLPRGWKGLWMTSRAPPALEIRKLSSRLSPVELTSVIEEVGGDDLRCQSEGRLDCRSVARSSGPRAGRGRGRLRRIPANLRSSPINGAPEGGTVRVVPTRTAPDARTSVANPGAQLDPRLGGMPSKPFERCSAGGYATGTGRRLSVVTSLVRAHGGRSW
jgi:hypothetical protein